MVSAFLHVKLDQPISMELANNVTAVVVNAQVQLLLAPVAILDLY